MKYQYSISENREGALREWIAVEPSGCYILSSLKLAQKAAYPGCTIWRRRYGGAWEIVKRY